MKKIVSLLIASILIISSSVISFAKDESNLQETPVILFEEDNLQDSSVVLFAKGNLPYYGCAGLFYRVHQWRKTGSFTDSDGTWTTYGCDVCKQVGYSQ